MVTELQVATFGVWILSLSSTVLLVVWGAPRLARLLFRSRVEAVRDDLEDALISGRLPDAPSVRSFQSQVEWFADNPQLCSLPRALALHLAMRDLVGDEAADRLAAGPGYDDLEPAERSLVRDFEGRIERAYQRFLMWGSPLGWVLAPLVWLFDHVRMWRGVIAVPRKTIPTLARESMSPGTAQLAHLGGPRSVRFPAGVGRD